MGINFTPFFFYQNWLHHCRLIFDNFWLKNDVWLIWIETNTCIGHVACGICGDATARDTENTAFKLNRSIKMVDESHFPEVHAPHRSDSKWNQHERAAKWKIYTFNPIPALTICWRAAEKSMRFRKTMSTVIKNSDELAFCCCTVFPRSLLEVGNVTFALDST